MAASLESGVSVSRYSIVGPIGAGGMGEVYKAQDSSLDRMVALKILPPDLVKNDERRRRFVQEARSASSLNHPHIVTIHEIGETTVEQTGQPVHYIAMELIDGSTLKRKIHYEQADLRTLLSWLAQAADGLAKAHTAGIVHRDLKPENIMVTRDGFAKVLDFGLAKLSVRKAAAEAADTTIAREETREGAVMGTVAYMSPEQVVGKVVDHRSDIFSFGAILYEAATRRRPFAADSDVDLMHKILHEKPQPIDEIDATVPIEVRRMVRRCLAKDPERRYQSMKDLSIELREIVDEYEDLSAATRSRTTTSQSGASAAPPRRRTLLWAGAAAAVIAIVTLGALLMRSRQAAAPGAAGATLNDLKIRTLTSSGNVLRSAISRDGRYVAQVVEDAQGRSSLRVRQVATGSEVEVAPAAEQRFAGVAFSPDSNYIYYARRDLAGGTVGWLYQVPSLGGSARKLVYDVDTAPGFSPDGKRIAFGRGMPSKNEHHYIITNHDGTAPRVAAVVPRFGLNFLTTPAWSPDGAKLLAAHLLPPGGALAKPLEIDLATGAQRSIGPGRWWWVSSVVPSPDGRHLYLAAVHRTTGRQQIWKQPYPDGEPRRITNDFNDYSSLSITADGETIAATASDTDGRLEVSETSRTGAGVRVENERAPHILGLVASSSGALVYTRRENASSKLAVLDSLTSEPRIITTNDYSDEPSVSADGKTIVYTALSNENLHVWATDPEGVSHRQITNGTGEWAPKISPDGKTILYVSEDKLWKRPLAGGAAVKIADRSTGNAGFSADSQTIFYAYWNSDQPSLSVRAQRVADGSVLFDQPWKSGTAPRAHPDNTGFTFVRPAGGGDNLFLMKFDGSEPVQLTRFGQGKIDSYGWLPDGRLVLIRTETRSDVVLITEFD
jgi:serine/threonine protein kinase/Tol biopolymer transport system component